jgi:hypothetical protein
MLSPRTAAVAIPGRSPPVSTADRNPGVRRSDGRPASGHRRAQESTWVRGSLETTWVGRTIEFRPSTTSRGRTKRPWRELSFARYIGLVNVAHIICNAPSTSIDAETIYTVSPIARIRNGRADLRPFCQAGRILSRAVLVGSKHGHCVLFSAAAL